MSHEDPRALLGEVRTILEGADTEGRELTSLESARCDALLDAAEALDRLSHLEAGRFEVAILRGLGNATHSRDLAAQTLLTLRGRGVPRSDLQALLQRMRGEA